jgi:multidrug resistance protein, MATE family
MVEAGRIVRLGIPLAIGGVSQLAMAVADAIMLGHYSTSSLAGLSVAEPAHGVLQACAWGGVAALYGLMPVSLGAGRPDLARRWLFVGIRYAAYMAIPLAILGLLLQSLFGLAGLDSGTQSEASRYLIARLPDLFPMLVMSSSRCYLESHGRTRPLVVVAIVMNATNIALNYLLINGDAGLEKLGLPGIGLPELGAMGSGLGTTISTWIFMGVLFHIARRHPIEKLPISDRADLPEPAVRPMYQLGWYISVEALAASAFMASEKTAAAFFAGIMLFSIAGAAAEGFGSATAVRVGFAVGARDRPKLVASIWASVAILLVVGAIFAVFGMVGGESWLNMFSNDPTVSKLMVPGLWAIGISIVALSLERAASGVAKGMAYTRPFLRASLMGQLVLGTLSVPILVDWFGLAGGFCAMTVAFGARGVFVWLAIITKMSEPLASPPPSTHS